MGYSLWGCKTVGHDLATITVWVQCILYFNLHFCYDRWCWVYFHSPFLTVYLFSKVSVQIFGPFLKLDCFLIVEVKSSLHILCTHFYFYFILFLNFTILYWFCQILKWIHHRYTYVPHPEPSRSSQCTSPKHPVLCIEPGLATHSVYDIIHISMPFSQIIPPSPSPTESKRLFYTSVSLLLSCIQGYCYHLSKFHIYELVYCIGIFLSGLLHSV